MGDPIKTACHCPGQPHAEDQFQLADELPMAAGLAASGAMQESSSEGDLLASVIPAMLRNGALARWNLVDDNGNPLPINARTISERLTWVRGREFIEQALPKLIASLNGESGPFASPTSRKTNGMSSSGGRTKKRTSRTMSSSPRPLEPSASSSPVSSDGEPSADPTP